MSFVRSELLPTSPQSNTLLLLQSSVNIPPYKKKKALHICLCSAMSAVIVFIIVFAASTQLSTANSKHTITVYRPRVTEHPPFFSGFANTPNQFLNNALLVFFDVCSSKAESFHWTVTSYSNPSLNVTLHSTVCTMHWQAPAEGEYMVKLTTPDGETSRNFTVKDIWIVAIGDSFASGQGNPDVPALMMGLVPARWLSSDCHRSAYGSWAFLTYKAIEQKYPDYGIQFTYLACSGTSIRSGLLNSNFVAESQLAVLSDIKAAAVNRFCKTKDCDFNPDAILLSVGGNDIDYSGIIFSMLYSELSQILLDIPRRFLRLRNDLTLLNRRISRLFPTLPSSAIFYPEYFDISRNEKGEVDASCAEFHGVRSKDLRLATERILQPLNRIIGNTRRRFGWSAVEGVADLFDRHGVCSGVSYIRTISDSAVLQGTCDGGFHPTFKGHVAVSNHVIDVLFRYLKKKL